LAVSAMASSTGGLCGDHGENAQALPLQPLPKATGKNGPGIGAGNGCERGDDGRGDTGLEAGGRGKLQREVAGDGDGGEVLFGRISDAGAVRVTLGAEGEWRARCNFRWRRWRRSCLGRRGGEAPADGGIGCRCWKCRRGRIAAHRVRRKRKPEKARRRCRWRR